MKNLDGDVFLAGLTSRMEDLTDTACIEVNQRMGIPFALNEIAKAIRYHGDRILEAERLKKPA